MDKEEKSPQKESLPLTGRWGASHVLTEFPKADVGPDPVNSPRTPSLPIAAKSFPLHRGSLAEKSYFLRSVISWSLYV